jgi:PAS domain S-box-containing protein
VIAELDTSDEPGLCGPIPAGLVEQMLDRSLDFVFRYRFRPERRFEYVNQAVTRLLGYTPEEFYADPLLHRKFDHPDDLDVLRELVLSGGKAGSPLVRWIRKDGAVVWVDQRIVCLYDDEGRIEAMEGIARTVEDPTAGPEPTTRVRRGLRIELLRQRVFVDGHKVRLTPAEYRLLVLLTEKPGTVVTRDEMARYLWQSPHAGNGHTCQAHISNLRRKIQPDPSAPSRIATVHGQGYRFDD